jgi:outer membrane protein assembly factor BamE
MRHFLLLLSILLVASCGTALPTVKPYKLDIQQGNVVTSKMLLQLRPGMTKSQVRYIMGTPLIQDSFHGNRWDYFYQMREGGKVIEQRRVILDFENEVLKTVRGDVVPSAAEAAQSADKPVGTRTVEPEAKPEEKGFFDKLKFWKKDENAPAKDGEQANIDAQQKAEMDAKKAAQEAELKAAEKPVEKMLPVEDVKPSEKAEAVHVSEEQVKPAEKKGFFERLKFWKGDEPATDKKLSDDEVKSLSGVPIVELPESTTPTK